VPLDVTDRPLSNASFALRFNPMATGDAECTAPSFFFFLEGRKEGKEAKQNGQSTLVSILIFLFFFLLWFFAFPVQTRSRRVPMHQECAPEPIELSPGPSMSSVSSAAVHHRLMIRWVFFPPRYSANFSGVPMLMHLRAFTPSGKAGTQMETINH
jgi:hypothetical protein